MKVYTIYSDSHQELFNLFEFNLGSWAELKARKAPQLCSGDYPGSVNFWKLNIEYFMELVATNKEPFLYLDCDVIVRGDPTADLQKRLGGRDLVGQLDKRIFGIPQICTGIMYIRPSHQIYRMFRWMLDNVEKYGNDQKALNRYLLFHNYHLSYERSIRWGVLPETYYSINYDNGNGVWDGEPLKIKPRDYKMFHLNWTIGTENKLKLWREFENRSDSICV
ncbi:MAG: glycosyltransferase family 77 protein [Alphaproteobacteria bacterium]|nr:glycosyltransferase family 77 protein [Alphaproteobacteria bacterium]